jgi:hypothetical protein
MSGDAVYLAFEPMESKLMPTTTTAALTTPDEGGSADTTSTRAPTDPSTAPSMLTTYGISTTADTASIPAGQLQLGTVTVLDPNTGELLGYAFTTECGAGQRQRWILYRHPRNSLMIAAPPATMADWTMDDWKAAVPQLWRPGSYYVRAQADLYAFGRTYGDTLWDVIPPSYLLPKPTFPRDDDDFQLDPCGRLIQWTHGAERMGSVFVQGMLEGEANIEYWLLLPGYEPAGGATPTAVTESTEMAPDDLGSFVDVANRSWAPGAVLAITGCRNFHDTNGLGDLPPHL